jgi:hypothetical protein
MVKKLLNYADPKTKRDTNLVVLYGSHEPIILKSLGKFLRLSLGDRSSNQPSIG